MFTGIVRDLGRVGRLEAAGDVLTLTITTQLALNVFTPGASIAVDGVCLTLVRTEKSALVFQAVRETLDKSTLGQLRVGDLTHLEPALRFNDPLDGHLVSGHVDGMGHVLHMQLASGQSILRFATPSGLGRYMLEKGSICIAGVSLTLFDVAADEASATLIPETLQRTHLGRLKKNDCINLEFDLLGKWIEKLLAHSSQPGVQKKDLLKQLRESGF